MRLVQACTYAHAPYGHPYRPAVRTVCTAQEVRLHCGLLLDCEPRLASVHASSHDGALRYLMVRLGTEELALTCARYLVRTDTLPRRL